MKKNKFIVIPMAGEGKRFKKAGYKLPKALIPILGRPMIDWAMESLNLDSSQVIFIVLKKHIKDYQINKYLQGKFGEETEVIGIDKVTKGQAETVLKAKKFIDNDKELIIFNCDTYFKCDLEGAISKFPNASGFIPVFKDTAPKWSFVKINSRGWAIETAEKKPISDNATVGLYHFRHGNLFVEKTEEMIARNQRIKNEFYVIPVYNRLIDDGHEIRIVNSEFVWVLGTPEDKRNFEKNYRGRLI